MASHQIDAKRRSPFFYFISEKGRSILTWKSSCKRVPFTALSLLLPPKRSSSTAWRLHLKLPLTLVPDSSRSGCSITMPASCSHLFKQQVQYNTHKQGQIRKFGCTALSTCAKPAEVREHQDKASFMLPKPGLWLLRSAQSRQFLRLLVLLGLDCSTSGCKISLPATFS